MLWTLSSPVTKAIDGGLKYLVRLMVKCSCLEVPACCLSTTRQHGCCHLGCRCPLRATWLCWAGGWLGLLVSEFREYTRHIPWQLVLVAVTAEKFVAHIWKWHWWLLSCALLWIPVKSFTASFLYAWKSLSSTLNLRCKLVAEGCSGGLCLGPRKDYSMVSFEQTDLLVNCWILENYAGACNRWLLCGVWLHVHLLSIHVSWTSGDFVCWGCSCTGCLDLGLEAWRFTESQKLNLSWIRFCLSIISLRARPDFDWVSFL